MSNMNFKDVLSERAKIAADAISEQVGAAYDAHHKTIGKLGIVDRVRGGRVQLRKKQSESKGYKVLNGTIVKMTPEESRKRKISAKISARKRRGMMAQIDRKRNISLRVRSNRLNENYNETDKVFLDKYHPTIKSGFRTNQSFDSGSKSDHEKAIQYHETELLRAKAFKAPGPRKTAEAYHTMRMKMHKDHIGAE